MHIAQIKVQRHYLSTQIKVVLYPRSHEIKCGKGLQLKVYDARPIVPPITRCDVTEELENGIVREIIFDNMPLKERIILYPKEKI